MIDRELSVSRGWIKDPERLAIAGVPDQVGFATKPALATAMLARALDARVPAAWVTGDEVYGTDPRLLAELERRGIGYVLAVACDHRLLAAVTPTAPTPCSGGSRRGPGSGCRPAAAPKATATTTGRSSSSTTATLPGGQAGQRWLLVRRNRKTGELAFSHCWTPRPVALATLVRVAGAPLDHRGALPDRQGPVWPGPAPGPSLAPLGPLDHPGHAHPRLPGGGRLDRTDPPPTAVRADRVALQQGPAPVRDTGCPSCW